MKTQGSLIVLELLIMKVVMMESAIWTPANPPRIRKKKMSEERDLPPQIAESCPRAMNQAAVKRVVIAKVRRFQLKTRFNTFEHSIDQDKNTNEAMVKIFICVKNSPMMKESSSTGPQSRSSNIPVETSREELMREIIAKYNPTSSEKTRSGRRKGASSTRRILISMKFSELMIKKEHAKKEKVNVRKKPNLQNLLLVSRCWMVFMA